LLDQVGELHVSEQGRDHRVDVVERPLGEVALAIGPQLVEQVDHLTCTDLLPRQIAEFGYMFTSPSSKIRPGLGDDEILRPGSISPSTRGKCKPAS
jgi:hypothetical protein